MQPTARPPKSATRNRRAGRNSAIASAEDVDLAVAAAKAAFPAWAALHPDQRARIMHRAADLIMERIDAIAELLTREQGKPVPDSRKEIAFGVEVIRYYAEEGRRVKRVDPPRKPLRYPQSGDLPAARRRRRDHPVELSGRSLCWKVAPVLAAGCVLVAKPPHETPLAIAMVVQCFEEAGLPPAC